MTAARRPILVVEDDPDIRDSLSDALDAEGYEVLTAQNGREALDQLAHIEPPCLILLDLMMPVMGGGEFLAILRRTAELAALPVVVVSAWPEEANQLAGETQGFMKKPVALRGLLETVARFCAAAGGEA